MLLYSGSADFRIPSLFLSCGLMSLLMGKKWTPSPEASLPQIQHVADAEYFLMNSWFLSPLSPIWRR